MIKHLTHTTVAVMLLSLVAVASAGALTNAVHPASIPACRTADLSARLLAPDAGAGQRYATLVLTNRSPHTCHTYGFVGLQLLDGRGRAMRTRVIRDRTYRSHRVVLAPGAGAETTLHWTVVPAAGETSGPCVSAPRRLEVTPPDERSHLTIGWRGGVVCQGGEIDTTRLTWAG